MQGHQRWLSPLGPRPIRGLQAKAGPDSHLSQSSSTRSHRNTHTDSGTDTPLLTPKPFIRRASFGRTGTPTRRHTHVHTGAHTPARTIPRHRTRSPISLSRRGLLFEGGGGTGEEMENVLQAQVGSHGGEPATAFLLLAHTRAQAQGPANGMLTPSPLFDYIHVTQPKTLTRDQKDWLFDLRLPASKTVN
jgi:hypothetical protein